MSQRMPNNRVQRVDRPESSGPVVRTQPRKKKKRRLDVRRIILAVIIVISAAAFIFAGIKLIGIFSTYNEASNSYDEVRKQFRKPGPQAIETVDLGIKKTEPATKEEDEFYWDFGILQGINPDGIGYLRMQGKGKDLVDYPVVQTNNNDYYINHMVDCSYNTAGAIFMDCAATMGFDGPYAVIYGHNMQSGSRMFGCLKQYKDEAFFKDHTLWDVYVREQHYIYRVFAAFTTEVDSYIYDYSAWDYGNQYGSMDQAICDTPYDTGVTSADLPEDSHIIALSTCLDVYSDEYRYIVLLYRYSMVDDVQPATNENQPMEGV